MSVVNGESGFTELTKVNIREKLLVKGVSVGSEIGITFNTSINTDDTNNEATVFELTDNTTVTLTFTLQTLARATIDNPIIFHVKKLNGGTGSFTIASEGSAQFDDNTTLIMTKAYCGVTLLCDGNNYHILNAYDASLKPV